MATASRLFSSLRASSSSRVTCPIYSRKASRIHRSHDAPAALSQERPEVYSGIYGDWSIDERDVAEVYGYRAGITVAAASMFLGAANMLAGLPLPQEALNVECVLAAGGLGVSLVLIHIYVTQIKRVIQALYVMGTLGGLWLMATQAEPLPVFVVENNWATLLVGPFFAAVTAVAIKEGLCYGKAEAAALAIVTPLWLLGHLTGVLPDQVEQGLAAAFTLIFGVFAARKYTQAIKDDIGDKSVFEFRKLSEQEQAAVIARMQASGFDD